MQGKCFMLFRDLGACFHPWEKWGIVRLVAWVQMRCGRRRSVWRLQGFSLPRTYSFIWKRLAEWSVAYSNDFWMSQMISLWKEWCVGSSNGEGFGYFERVSKNTRVKLHRNHWYQCIAVCHWGDVFISANIQELISKTYTGRERKCKHPGLGSQLVIVSTMLENSSGLPNALLFAGCLIIYSTNKGAEKKLNFFWWKEWPLWKPQWWSWLCKWCNDVNEIWKDKTFFFIFFFLVTKFEPICLLCIPANGQKILKNLENKETF